MQPWPSGPGQPPTTNSCRFSRGSLTYKGGRTELKRHGPASSRRQRGLLTPRRQATAGLRAARCSLKHGEGATGEGLRLGLKGWS
jgi:hypothetical protein